MFAYKKIFIPVASLSFVVFSVFAAENCEPLPNCKDIGFKYSSYECQGLEKMKCPFDDIHYFCSYATCPSGYTSGSCSNGKFASPNGMIAAGKYVCKKCVTCPFEYAALQIHKPKLYHYETRNSAKADDGKTDCYELQCDKKIGTRALFDWYNLNLLKGYHDQSSYLDCIYCNSSGCSACTGTNASKVFNSSSQLEYTERYKSSAYDSTSYYDLMQECKNIMDAIESEIKDYEEACQLTDYQKSTLYLNNGIGCNIIYEPSAKFGYNSRMSIAYNDSDRNCNNGPGWTIYTISKGTYEYPRSDQRTTICGKDLTREKLLNQLNSMTPYGGW